MFETNTLAHFKFTRELETAVSSNVDQAWYNEIDNTLVVDLSDRVYRYSGVPVRTAFDFENAPSAGQFFGREIKSRYGPGEYLGQWEDVEPERVTKEAERGTPKGLTYASDAEVSAAPTNYFDLDAPQNVLASSGQQFDLVVPGATDEAGIDEQTYLDGEEVSYLVKIQVRARSVVEAKAIAERVGIVKKVSVKF